MGRVVHFEIHADDPERAKRFYERVFGWVFQRYAPQEYWLITTGPDEQAGINGGLLRRNTRVTGEGFTGFVCTIDVADLDATLENAVAAGAGVVMPRDAIPGVGWLAYVRDTEGNTIGLMQSDSNAK